MEQERPLEDWWEAHMASLPERVQYGGKKSWRIALVVKVGAHKHNMVKETAMEQQNSESARLPR